MKTTANTCFLPLLLMVSIVSSFRSICLPIQPRLKYLLSKSTIASAKYSEIRDRMSINSSSILKPKVMFILGGPGAGKGTQCELLSSEFGMVHLSAGELLRNERASGSENGKLIELYLKEGKIVPVQITIDLLKQAMENFQSNRYLIDGFPRNWDNIRGWESTMEDSCDVEGVLFLDCPEDVLETRILGRGLTSGRSDDNIETVRKRFFTYKESTIPILEHYDQMKRLIRIRGDQDKNAVFDHLKVAVLPLIEKEILAIQAIFLRSVGNWVQYSSLCDKSISTLVNSGSEMRNVEGLEEHRDMLAKVGKLLYFSMSESKDLSVEVTGKRAKVSRTLQVATNRSVLETRVWKIVDGYWKLVSVCIEDI